MPHPSAPSAEAIRDVDSGYCMFQTAAAASEGSSGGGMFNAYGALSPPSLYDSYNNRLGSIFLLNLSNTQYVA